MLGLRFSRLVHASLAGGSLALSGCVDRAYSFDDAGFGPAPDDSDGTPDTDSTTGTPPGTTTETPPPLPDVPGAPRLINAVFLDAQTLVLAFNEAVAPPTQVDPQQFRLSATITTKPGYEYGLYGTVYQELGVWNGDGYYCEEYCYEYCYMDECYERCWENCYSPPGPPVRIASLAQPADRPEVIVAKLENPLTRGLCQQLENFPPEWIADIFVHYTPQGAAQVTDLVGDALLPIAEHWALDRNKEFEYYYEYLPFMDPVLPIPCPQQ